MRFSIDANVLIYSFEVGSLKNDVANRLMFGAIAADCILTNQCLGEFLNVVRRRLPERLHAARAAVEGWSVVFPIAPTTTEHLLAASVLAERHKLQFWDSVILTVAGSAQAEWLLSEDMQDGATIAGVRLLNPFNPDHAELLDALLTPLI